MLGINNQKEVTNPSLEGKRHIINMFAGGRSQYLARAQGMPKEIEDLLCKMIHTFLWDGQRARVASDIMMSDIKLGGKQILDIVARNEAIDLWNLKLYLTLGPDRPSWCYLVDFLLCNYLETSYLNYQPGQIVNIFLQGVYVPISNRTPLPDQVKTMILTARKYKLTFTGLVIDPKLKLEMPIWRHPGARSQLHAETCRKKAAKCLQTKHAVHTVRDAYTIASRTTIDQRHRHIVNPSGIGRQNCGCPLCKEDRETLGCKNPGKCIDVAKRLISSLHPKWNPCASNADFCAELSLSVFEKEENKKPIETDRLMSYDADYILYDIQAGFRVFAFDEVSNLPAKRHAYRLHQRDDSTKFVFLHPKILNGLALLSVKIEQDMDKNAMVFNVSFDDAQIPSSQNTLLLAGVLCCLQNCGKNQPLVFCSSSDFLAHTLVVSKCSNENDLLNPTFNLLKAVIAALNEHAARIQFKKVTDNPAKWTQGVPITPVEIDTEVDITFNCSGIQLSTGSQRSFTKIIKKLKTITKRKTTQTNLARIQAAVEELCKIKPSEPEIWTSIRSTTLQRLSREFYWKCIHGTFRVGTYWDHIPQFEHFGICTTCQVPDTLEHMALECYAPGQSLIWRWTSQLWSRKYSDWPAINWGLILGCKLVRFRSSKGKILHAKGRLFSILVSVAWHEIWRLRVDRVITNPGKIHTEVEIFGKWLKAVNRSLSRDRILANKIRFGSLAIDKQLVLSTWSGLLENEDALPDNWINDKGVLVGRQPFTFRAGVG